jgi:natural product biosynthesis luciferase-like monooxygenase protein/amino acid adenylation domain-containing protein/non-ribosomal peptide synthase protein (TIGR01720 family)
MWGRWPGANNPEEFWRNLRDGVESVTFFSDEELMASGKDVQTLNSPNFVKAAPVLEGVELFDASFFGYNPREAEILDPQHRIFLECAHSALEDSGCDYERFTGRIGVYAGAGANSYFLLNILGNENLKASMVGPQMLLYSNDKDYLCSRVSYKLNLKGPSLGVQTACSTSLVAIHLACQSLINYECDMALAGGVSVTARQKSGYLYQNGGIVSPDGHCRAFDAKAQGTIFGSGVGVVVLKRLEEAIEDGDPIRAVIRGSAINNDGSLKVGYTAPSVEGQAEVISEALAIAKVEPHTIGYVEAHGTGTSLGDPIEVAALTEAFTSDDGLKQYCALGSVKTNVGHLDTAACVSGLIKTVLALENRLIPPSLNFEKPNPAIDFANSPFYVNSKLSEWKASRFPRRAGVSSFGIGGTNAHLIIEEAPERKRSTFSALPQLLVLSAKSEASLQSLTRNLADHLRQHPDLCLADVAYTLQTGRRAFGHRRAVVCRGIEDAVNSLRSPDHMEAPTAKVEPENRPAAFLFPGQGSQYINMGAELYLSEPLFKEQVDLCCEILKPHLGFDLREALYPGDVEFEQAAERLNQTAITQPALFVIEYSLAKLWMALGLKPGAFIGHSIGEYVAACLSGVFTLADALKLVAARGRLIQGLPGGAMLSVPLAESEISRFLSSDISLAAVNSPTRCVVSGPAEAIEELETSLLSKGIQGRVLPTSHAFHSQMMEPVLGEFIKVTETIKLSPPQIPYLSNVTGKWISEAEATDPNYWAAHLRRAVRFDEGVKELLKAQSGILLEVGPGRTLTTLAAQQAGKHPGCILLTSLRSGRESDNDIEFLLKIAGRLWLAGVNVEWEQLQFGLQRNRVTLPTYPFERKRHWLEAPRGDTPGSHNDQAQDNQKGDIFSMAANQKETAISNQPATPPHSARRDNLIKELKIAFKGLTGIETESMDVHATFFEMGADSLLLVQVSQLIQDRFNTKITFRRLFEDLTTLDSLAGFLESEMPEEALEEFTPLPAPPATGDQEGERDTGIPIMPQHTEAPPSVEARQSALPSPVISSSNLSVEQNVPQPAAKPALRAPSQQPGNGSNGHAYQGCHEQVAAGPVAQPRAQANGGPAPLAQGNTVERIFSQQLQVMSQIVSEQISALRYGSGANGNAASHLSHSTSSDAQANEQGVIISGTPDEQNTVDAIYVETREPMVVAPDTQAKSSAHSCQSNAAASKLQPEPYIPYKSLDVRQSTGLSVRQQEYLNAFIERYTKRTAKSKMLAQSARPRLADTRLSTGFRSALKEMVYPIYSDRSVDSRVWDVDGNEYVDLAMGYGVHLFGNSPTFVSEALEEQIRNGLALAPQRELTAEVAKLVCDMTGTERANFCNSGTEAVGGAIRIARTITRRNRIAMFSGSFHGWADSTMVRKTGLSGALKGGPSAPGVSPETAAEVMVLDYDSPESLEIIKAHAHELAAVLVEPVQSRRPDLQPTEFLRELRRITAETGIALIFDEMVTGFRIHQGGAQAYFGIEADIATYGKIVGGGMPIGVIAGKSRFLDAFDGGVWNYADSSYPQSEHTFFAGTFFKHPLTMAAAHAVLKQMKEQGPTLQENLNRRTSQMVETIRRYFEQSNVPIRVVNFGSLFRFFSPRDLQLPELFFYHLTQNGIFNWEGGNYFLSAAHTDEDIDRAVEAIFLSVEQMQDGGFLPGPPPNSPGRERRSSAVKSNSNGNHSQATRMGNGSRLAAPAASQAPNLHSLAVVSEPDARRAAIQERPVAELLERSQSERMQFSLYYFGNYPESQAGDKYELLLKTAKFADRNGFSSVWMPERHFNAIGGISPNPSVVAAAVARDTERIRLCAGSVVVPLHNPIRIAEEWSIVDNISQGRVALSFASGWHPNDFVFAPDSYADRRNIMLEGIETVRHLWRGGSVRVREGSGKEIAVKLYPSPKQADLPFWLTGGSRQTLEDAGRLGAGFLTNLVDHTVEELAEKIVIYRDTLAANGFDPKSGHVTLLLHTFMGDDVERVRQSVRGPFYDYLKNYFRLVSNKVKSQGQNIDVDKLSDEDFSFILSNSYERYIQNVALIGSPDSCAPIVEKLISIGVDEISCLVDFGVSAQAALESLNYVSTLKNRFQNPEAHPSPVETIDLRSNESKPESSITIPVTDVQKQVWILSRMSDEVSKGLHVSVTLDLRGQLNMSSMRKSVQALFKRHEALRVTACPDGERQIIHSASAAKLSLVDFSYLGEQEQKNELASWVTGEARRPFDLERGPLVRFAVARLSDERHLLVLTAHHFTVDGRSAGILLTELASLYSAECHGTTESLPAPASFREYVERVLENQQGPESVKDEAYWQEMFADGLPVLEMPVDRPRPDTPTYNGARLTVKFGPPLCNDLDKLSSKRGSSLFMTTMAGFKVLLHQLTGQSDLTVGINVAQHLSPTSRNLVAFTVNPVTLRSKIAQDLKFSEYLAQVKDRVLGAYEHQNVTASSMSKKIKIRRDPKKWNLVPVSFNLDRASGGLNFFGLKAAGFTNSLDSSRLDLYLDITEIRGELTLDCDYDANLFDEATIQSWLSHYQKLLEAIATNPEGRITDLPRYDKQSSAGIQGQSAKATGDSELLGLTKYQSLIWAGQKLHPNTALYINAGYGIIPAAIDRQHYRLATQAFIDRCDAMRVVIVEDGGAPRQRVLPELPYEPEFVDLSGSADPRAELDRWAHNRCRVPLNLQERLFDAALIKLSENEYGSYLNIHHIVSDAWSVTIISSLIARYYEMSLAGKLDQAEDLSRFRDFVSNELNYVNSARSQKAEAYWKERLSEEVEPLKFYGKTHIRRSTRVQRISCDLGVERTSKLKSIAARSDIFTMSEDVSLHHVFASIVSTYLYRVTGSRRISLGAPFNNRWSHKETIGLLMQILPLRVTLEEGDSFLSLIGKIGSEHFKILRYHQYQIGNPLQKQLYDVEYNFINARNPRLFNGEPVKHQWLHPGHGTESLAIQIFDNLSGSFTCEFDFHCDVFDEAQRPLAIEHFLQVVDALIGDVDENVNSISLVSQQERERLVYEFNRAAADFPRDTTFAHLFDEQVRRTPDKIAVADKDQSLSYAELGARADSLAHHLVDLGIGPETIVALLSRRSIDLLTAILAVFKAGGAYLPLDPEYPAERIAGLLTQSKSKVVLAAVEFWPQLSEALEQIPAEQQPLALPVEELLERESAAAPLSPRCGQDNISYVIYTSGSTGTPKGAMVEHSGMLNHLFIKVTDLQLAEGDTVAQSASQCSDVSVWQFLAALLVGARVYIVDDEIVKDPTAQLRLVEREAIKILEIVPSQLRAMLEGMAILGSERPGLTALKTLIVNGEALPPETCRRWFESYPQVALMNAYGPTECSDDVTHFTLRHAPPAEWSHVPIGRALPNMRLFVLDERLSLAPLGACGELHIGGVGVGRGYLDDPIRTAQSFIPDAFSAQPGQRLYKTGDLVRYRPDGNLEFIDRIDHQVKIKGFRIELSEVEGALAKHPSVAQAVVIAREDAPGDKRLVAYLVTGSNHRPTTSELRNFVRAKLPDYMVPSAFVLLDSLPLTPNGKINRKALPAPDSSRPELEGEFVAPRNDVERALAQIWAEVLGVEQVGINDNFFDLGGDSILIILIAAKANQAGLRLTPMQIFEHHTIAELAEVVGSAADIEAEQGEVTGAVPLTPVQHWFFEQDVPDVHHYNQAVLLELQESVDPSLLEEIVSRLLSHHDALRLRFVKGAGKWEQFIAAADGLVPFFREDLTRLSQSEQGKAIEARAAQIQSSLNLFDGPVVKFAFFDLGDDRPARLLIAAHHLTIDGVSWRILLTDLQLGYEQLKKGQSVALPSKTTSFKQWSERLSQYSRSDELKQEADYWLSIKSAPLCRIPSDFDGVNTRDSVEKVSILFDEQETRALLQDVAETLNAQINDVLLTALARALSGWTGAPAHLVKLEGHGREQLFEDLDVSRTVGWFTSMTPVLLDVGDDDSPLGALRSVKNQLRQIPNKGIGFGMLRYLGEEGAINEQLASLASPEVEFNYLGQFDQMVSGSSLFKPAKESSGATTAPAGTRDHLLDINAIVLNKQLQVDWFYSKNLHKHSTVEALAERYREELMSFITHTLSLQAGEDEIDYDEFDWSQDEVDEIASALERSA